MNKKVLIVPALVVILGAASLGLSTKASAMSLSGFLGIGKGNDNENGAQVSVEANAHGDFRGGPDMPDHVSGVFGTVTAISGDTITIQSKGFSHSSSSNSSSDEETTSTATAYTVNATNATVLKNNAASSVSNIAVGDTIMVQGTVSGTSVTATKINDGMMIPQSTRGIAGTVTAVNGNTITVQNKAYGSTPAATYTVNASSATVTKSGVASSVSNIAVGDMVMVQGTVSGSSVTATRIIDGVMPHPTSSKGDTELLPGNGQPIIGGKVTAVSGNTVTITNSSNTPYTIDVTNAKITKGDTASSVSNIAVGDEVIAQGTINGNSVTAVNFVDGAAANSSVPKGIFAKIGTFFSHIFGF